MLDVEGEALEAWRRTHGTTKDLKAKYAAEQARLCTELSKHSYFTRAWSGVRAASEAHMRAHYPSEGILLAWKHLLDNVLPSVLVHRNVVYRSAEKKVIVMVRFKGLRYALQEDLTSTSSSNRPAPTAKEAIEDARTFYMYAFINAETVTIECNDGDDIGAVGVMSFDYAADAAAAAAERAPATAEEADGYGEAGVTGEEAMLYTDEQVRKILAKRVMKKLTWEAPIMRMPQPRGLETTVETDSRQRGEFIVNGKRIQPRWMRAAKTNKPMLLFTKMDNKNKRHVVRCYSLADGTYRSPPTISVFNQWHGPASKAAAARTSGDTTPDARVRLPYPRKQDVSLFEAFLTLHVHRVKDMVRLMWPHGIQPRKRMARAQAGLMLRRQQAMATKLGRVDRASLFKSFSWKNAPPDDGSPASKHTFKQFWHCAFAEMFPQQGTTQRRDTTLHKALELAHMAAMLVEGVMGLRPLDDQDAPCNQIQQGIDALVGKVVGQTLRNHLVPRIRAHCKQEVACTGEVDASNVLNPSQLTSAIFSVFNGQGNSSSTNTADVNAKWVQSSRYAPTAEECVTIHSTVPTKGATQEVRQHRPSTWGDIDPPHTPDGEQSSLVSRRPNAAVWRGGHHKWDLLPCVQAVFEAYGGLGSLMPPHDEIDLEYIHAKRRPRSAMYWCTPVSMQRAIEFNLAGGRRLPPLVLINRYTAGCLPEGMTCEEAVRLLRAGRTRGTLDWNVSVLLHPLGVEVLSDNGDTVRPVVPLERYAEFVERANDPSTPRMMLLQELMRRGCVQYVSKEEVQTLGRVVATSLHDLRSRGPRGTAFTDVELHPYLVLMGPTIGRIPMAPMGASPRIMFSGMMIGQSASIGVADADVSRHGMHLAFAAKPIVHTLLDEVEPIYNTFNAVMAVVSDPMLKDDAFVLSRDAVDRGLGAVTQKTTFTTFNTKNSKVVGAERMSEFSVVHKQKHADYSRLDEDGVIRRGEKVLPNKTVLMRKVAAVKGSNGSIRMEDCSILHDRSGSVDDVWTVQSVEKASDENHHRYTIVLSRFILLRVGDKLATRHGQKATISEIRPSWLMPFCENDGMIPDIMIGSSSILGRMTVNNSVDIMAGAAAAQRGECIDGTPWEPFDMEAVHGDVLSAGLTRVGGTHMIDGHTGLLLGRNMADADRMDTPLANAVVAIGILPLMKLKKHTASGKVHAIGPTASLSQTTRQPLRGRRRGGGVRFGKMPMDAAVQHGATFVTVDAVERSNISTLMVCETCHRFGAHPPLDFVNMAEARSVEARTEMRAMLQEALRCRFCEKGVLRATRMPQVVKLIANVLRQVNIEMLLHINPLEGQEIHAIQEAAQRLADAEVRREEDPEGYDIARLAVERMCGGLGAGEGAGAGAGAGASAGASAGAGRAT